MPPEEAKQIIEEESGKHFDPDVVAAFTACFEQLVMVRRDFEMHPGTNDLAKRPRLQGSLTPAMGGHTVKA